jgi:hypothetical protein
MSCGVGSFVCSVEVVRAVEAVTDCGAAGRCAATSTSVPESVGAGSERDGAVRTAAERAVAFGAANWVAVADRREFLGVAWEGLCGVEGSGAIDAAELFVGLAAVGPLVGRRCLVSAMDAVSVSSLPEVSTVPCVDVREPPELSNVTLGESPVVVAPPAESSPSTSASSSDPAPRSSLDCTEPPADVPSDSLESPADVDPDESVEELGLESETDGSAQATPGVVVIAMPTPNATANPPTRPTYLALPIVVPLPSAIHGVRMWIFTQVL